jgi:hypothetical protein
MAEQTTLPAADLIDHAKIDAALDSAFRELLLEHARMGRSVSESRDGKVVTVTPTEIFARYGLDEFGRPKPEEKGEVPMHPDDPLLIAQMEEWREAERLENEGKFEQYRGEYVFYSNGTVFGHGRNLADLRPIAEAKAATAGIPPERLIDYFVPSE